MEIEELLKYREELLNESKDDDSFLSEPDLLRSVLPLMFDAKLVDSEEYNETAYYNETEKIKINGYSINESGERLQLYIVNDDALDLKKEKEYSITQKSYYEEYFSKASRFINKSIKGHLFDIVQDGDPIKSFLTYMVMPETLYQIDVIEVFLISTTATVEARGSYPKPKRLEFDDESIQISFLKEQNTIKKEFTIIKTLIDLNFLYTIIITQGNRDELVIDFEEKFKYLIPAIQAAEEINFESYLCVLPANILAELYKRYSSRLLEKNVRSFLDFKGVNKGIRETIRNNPEKFIAYNNGLTITAKNKETRVIGEVTMIKSLTDFQIVNGGQTTASIYFTSKDGIPIDKVRVMAKINVAKDISQDELEEMISRISQYSNTQNKVSNVDLRTRSPQLNKIKSLSESIVTPKGLKWFFEKSRGEFNTMLRLAGKNKSLKLKEYPKERRFSKEDLGKYFCAWGEQPYMVKKGGEKIFKYFIEEISKDKKGKAVKIDRNFFEELISKIILFRSLEKIYGQGKNSMGQLRSVAVPYTISVLYSLTTHNSNDLEFNLHKIWQKEGLDKELADYLTQLMGLMNELIKKYSGSEDYGEYSKKKDLWDSIWNSQEIKSFTKNADSEIIKKKFCVKKESKKKENSIEVDFKQIADTVRIFSKGAQFYQRLESLLEDTLTQGESVLLESIIHCITTSKDLELKHIDFENDFINKIKSVKPEILDYVSSSSSDSLSKALDLIIKTYNQSIDLNINILDGFKVIQKQAEAKKTKYASVFSQIGESLINGVSPTIKQVVYASQFFDLENSEIYPEESEADVLNLSLLVKMVEWDSKYKVLTIGERQYLANLAYGFKTLTKFDESRIRKYLSRLKSAGFDNK